MYYLTEEGATLPNYASSLFVDRAKIVINRGQGVNDKGGTTDQGIRWSIIMCGEKVEIHEIGLGVTRGRFKFIMTDQNHTLFFFYIEAVENMQYS